MNIKKVLSLLSIAALIPLFTFSAPKAHATYLCGSCPDLTIYVEGANAIDNPSAKYPIMVDTPYTFHIYVNQDNLKGKKVTFSSPNPWLALDNGGSISDGGTSNKTTNFTITWPQGNDGDLTFRAKVLPSNTSNNMSNGYLMTVGAHIIGAKCGPKLELYGTSWD